MFAIATKINAQNELVNLGLDIWDCLKRIISTEKTSANKELSLGYFAR